MASSVGNNRLFLDANILLEVILDRPRQQSARRILSDNPGNRYISALTAHLIMHFGQARVSAAILQEFLADYTILPLEDSNFTWAFKHILNDDFEDALQLAVATKAGCKRFITFDKSLHDHYQGKIDAIAITIA